MNSNQYELDPSGSAPDLVEIACADMTRIRSLSIAVSYFSWALVSVAIWYLMIALRGIMTLGLGFLLDHDVSIMIARYISLAFTSIFIVRMTNYEWFDYRWATDSNGLSIHRPFHFLNIKWNSITSAKLIRGNSYLELKLTADERSLGNDSVKSHDPMIRALRAVFGYGTPRTIRVNLSNMNSRIMLISILTHLRILGLANNMRYVNGVLAAAPENEPDTDGFKLHLKWYARVSSVPHIKSMESFGKLSGVGSRLAVLIIPAFLVGGIFARLMYGTNAGPQNISIAFCTGYFLEIIIASAVWKQIKVDATGIYMQTLLLDSAVAWEQIRSVSLVPEELSCCMEILLHNGRRMRYHVTSPDMELTICMHALEHKKADGLLLSEFARSIYTPIPDDIPDEMTWTISWVEGAFTVNNEYIRQSVQHSTGNIAWKNVDIVTYNTGSFYMVNVGITADRTSLSVPFIIVNLLTDPGLITPEALIEAEINRRLLLAAFKHIRLANPSLPVWFCLDMLRPVEEIRYSGINEAFICHFPEHLYK